MNRLRRLLANLRLEWNHLRRDRSALMWTVIMPFLFMLFFGSVFRQDSAARENRRVALAVRDEDDTPTSAAFTALLDTTRLEITTADTASAPRTLVIPTGFQDSVLAAHPVTVRNVRHESGDEEFSFAADAAIFRALVRFHGALAAAMPDSSGWSDSSWTRWNTAVQATSNVRVDSRWAGVGLIPSGFRQSVPGNLVVFVLMSTVIGAATLLVTERTSGALRRVATAPIPSSEVVLSRVLARWIIAALQVLLLLGGAHLFFGYRIAGNAAAFLAVALAFAFTCVGIGLFIGSRFGTVAAAAMASWIASMMMSSIGGAWWPLEVVPKAMRAAAHLFPTAWAMDGLHAVATYGGGFREAAIPILVLLAMGAVAIAAAAHRIRAGD